MNPVRNLHGPIPIWRYIGGLAPVVLLWAALVAWLAVQLYDRGQWSDQADEATLKEWLEETRTFRQSLPLLVRDYEKISPDDARRKANKRDEIEDQMRALIEPTRMFASQLPSFPEIYLLAVSLHEPPEEIAWRSPLPRPAGVNQSQIRRVEYHPDPDDANFTLICEYRLHAFNRLKKSEEDRQRTSLVAGALLVTATVLAALFVWRFLQREHQREIERLTAIAAAQSLQQRAIEAEKNALEVKSQIYASIGIMAGSYAHNIKNLLVRPNDLLNRCLEADGLTSQQEAMLGEVKATLGTVTERLQEILRTVRRDPQQSHSEKLDLNALVNEAVAAWHDTALDKWKLQISAELCEGEFIIQGDASHLQQAIENLIFNARDATFEMRNQIRDAARNDATDRKQKLIAAAGWKGQVTLRTLRTEAGRVLEVQDNGIGMTEAVKANCLKAHFTTKRDNALYEGYSAGMGLGLSFVAMVLERHAATLSIESSPSKGACFRIQFPMTNGS